VENVKDAGPDSDGRKGRIQMNDWRVPEDKVRACLADRRDMSEPVSDARLRELGYEPRGWAEAQAQASADAREAKLLRLPRPAEMPAEAS
jgi:hypothetical protein